MFSFKNEFEESAKLAKLLELKWCEFYSPTATFTSSEYIGDLKESDLAVRGKHCMPFLRRNLSYIREDIPKQTKQKQDNGDNGMDLDHTSKVTKSCSTSYSSSTLSQSPSNMNRNRPMPKIDVFPYPEHEDEDEEVDVTVISSSDDTSCMSENKINSQVSCAYLHDENTVGPSLHHDAAPDKCISEIAPEYKNLNENVAQKYGFEENVVVHELKDDESPPYNPLTMGPPLEYRSHFALFSRFNRERARQAVSRDKQWDKAEIRKEIIRMWDLLSPSDVEFWFQQHENDKNRYDAQRKMYFKALVSDSGHPQRLPSSSSTPSRNATYASVKSISPSVENCFQPSKVFYYYKYIDEKSNPELNIEMRKDLRCPFCFFRALSSKGLMLHCASFHHCFSFDQALDEEKNLHVSVCRRSKTESSSRMNVHLINFIFIRSRASLKNTTHSQHGNKRDSNSIPFVKRSHSKAAHLDSAVRRKKIRILKQSGADNDTISRFVRSDKIPVRQYYRSRSNVLMQENDWECDSDEDSDEGWLQRYSQEVTNEFEDVPENEKKFMLHWNKYIKSHTTISDRSLPQRCMQFIRSDGEKLIEPDLRQNLLLHLFNLWDNGLISSKHIICCIKAFDVVCREYTKKNEVLVKNNTIAQAS